MITQAVTGKIDVRNIRDRIHLTAICSIGFAKLTLSVFSDGSSRVILGELPQ